MDCDGKGEDGAYDTDSQRPIDTAPPSTVGAIIADQNKEKNAKNELANSDEIQELRVAEKRHVRAVLTVVENLSRWK